MKQYKYAGFWVRLGAAIIDGILAAVTIYIYYLVQIYLTGKDGRTVGKMLFKIKVIRTDGKPLGLGGAILREVIGKFISSIVIGIGYLWIIFDDNKQGWHDKIAESYVIYDDGK